MKKHLIYWLAAFVIVMVGCQKELSFEGSNSPAKGSLLSDVTGDCLPKTVNGTYVAGTPLVPATNTISVQVNVSKTGTYEVTTDTVNGFYFRATGIFTTLGANNVTLRGFGTPFSAAAGVYNFVVNFDTTFCDIQVPVISPGIGTLAGAPGACAPITVNGGYSPGVALTASNNVVVQVNVTTAGIFNITTDTMAGIWFSFSGSLPLSPPPQSVTLVAHGAIPAATATGPQTFKVKLGASQCTFVVNIAGPAGGTLDGAPTACTPVTLNGNYTKNIDLVPATNTVQIRIDVITAGAYNITAVSTPNPGFSFSGSGTVAVGNDQTITLNGTGKPTVSGPVTFTVTFGSSSCTFVVNIDDGLGKWTPDCSTAFADGLYETGTQLNCTNTVDIDVNVTALGPYTISTAPAVNGITFTASSTFTTLGVQTITLVGSGTPINTGTFNFTMPGTTTCTFPVFVDVPLLPIGWEFTKTNTPSTIYRGQFDVGSLDPGPVPPGVLYTFQGSNSIGSDALVFVLSDANGTIANGEQYSTTGVTGNLAAFSYTLPFSTNCSDTYSADPSISGVTMIFKVTTHDVIAQTITGTYTGTAKNAAGQTITIAAGTFTGDY